MFYINFDTTEAALESGIIESICSYPGPMDSTTMPINNESFTAGTFTIVSPENMTSNIAPSPYITGASSEYDANTMAFNAFDSSSTSHWASFPAIINDETYGPHFLFIDLGANQSVSRIKIMPKSISQYAPLYFKIYILCSDDAITWDHIIYASAPISNATWIANSETSYLTFNINQNLIHNKRYYRIYFAACNGAGNHDVGRYYAVKVAKAELYTTDSGTFTFTIPKIKRKAGKNSIISPDTHYDDNVLFMKNEKLLIEGTDYSIDDDQITFNEAPSSTDSILVCQRPNGPMWFVEYPTSFYEIVPLPVTGSMSNLVPVMSSNSTPSPYRCYASSTLTGMDAYKAFDGNNSLGNGWQSEYTATPQWLAYDFSTNPQSLSSITILPLAYVDSEAPTKVSPVMNSNSAPTPYVVSASSETATHEAFRAFNGYFLAPGGWLTETGTTHWVKIDLGTAQIVNAFSIFPYVDETVLSLTRFSLQGSNDNLNWDLLGDEKIGISGWEVNVPKFFDAHNETAYRYYRLYIIVEGSPAAAGVAELELYYSTGSASALQLDTFSFEGSSDGTNWTPLYSTSGLNGSWIFGQAKHFSFQNSAKYRFYRLFAYPSDGYVGVAELEMRSLQSNDVTNRIIVNASIAHPEPGYKKLRVKYYDTNQVLITDYFNVPFWDNYELQADDLNDFGDYVYSLITSQVDDTGIYSIVRDSNNKISRINRTFYAFDNSLHTENIAITRTNNYITNIVEYTDGVITKTAEITRDFDNLINVVNIESGS